MKDILLKLYELNERYHDTKEKMAWLGSSLYFAFSLAILRILFIEGIQKIINGCPLIIVGFLTVICGCALWFINIQYKKKRISVGISNEFMEILPDKTLTDENKLEKMIKCINEINDDWRRYKKDYKKKYKKKYKKFIFTEIPINLLIFVFLISQILIIIYLKC